MSVAASHVRDCSNATIGHEVDVAIVVAHLYVAQSDLLYYAGMAADRDYVALAKLVLQQQEEAGEIILDEALGAEANS